MEVWTGAVSQSGTQTPPPVPPELPIWNAPDPAQASPMQLEAPDRAPPCAGFPAAAPDASGPEPAGRTDRNGWALLLVAAVGSVASIAWVMFLGWLLVRLVVLVWSSDLS